MGEDYEAGSRIMDRGGMGGGVWICTAERGRLGESEGHSFRG